MHVGYMHYLYQTTQNSDKGTYRDRISHSPNLSVPLGGEGDAPCLAGLAELKLAHCCTLSPPVQGTALGSNEQPRPSPSFLPHCHPRLLPQSSSIPYSFLFILGIQNCPRWPPKS